jgi:RHS repeat-associated protein
MLLFSPEGHVSYFLDKHYTGQEKDEETGLYYFGARYLNPQTSMWLSADPAMGEYVPVAPINDEAKKHNQNLPGMGGVFNTVNLHTYLYAGNNPIVISDPNGMWINNYDGTFTAEKDDTLWGLQQETGRDWKTSDYTGDPKKLQIGQRVSFSDENASNNFKTIDSTSDAVANYYFGNGEPVNLGVNVRNALRLSPTYRQMISEVNNGETKEYDKYRFNLTEQMFFMGFTSVDIHTTVGTKYRVTNFTAFIRDGFWDIIGGDDGQGKAGELPFGKPYSFVPYKWTVSRPK